MYKLFKTAMATCLSLCLAATGYAQTFTCSSNLSKVGPTGLVTVTAGTPFNVGDIIVLPWTPNSGSTANSSGDIVITATPPSGSSSFSWSTKGDIGVVASTLVNTSTTSTNGFNVINEQPRTNSLFDYGQSKGRCILTYTLTSCGPLAMYFDVIKSFTGNNVNGTITPTGSVFTPPIIGPDCIQSGKTYTYSVDPVMSDNLTDQIGLDRYKWDISSLNPVSTSIYYSTDSSSITFTAGTAITSAQNISCIFGVANLSPWGSNNAYATKTVSPGATTPAINVTLAGASISAPYCIPLYTSTPHNLVLSVASPQAGVSYTWSFGTYGLSPNNWSVVGQSGTSAPYTYTGNSVTITDVGNQPGTITLTQTDGCGVNTSFTYTFNRSINNVTAGQITLSTNCIMQGGNTPTAATATLATSANLNPITWTPSTNWTYPLVGQGQNQIIPGATVAVGQYNGSGFPQMTATLGCANTVTSTTIAAYTVYVRPSDVLLTPTPTLSVSQCNSSAGPISLSSPSTLCSGCTDVWSLGGTFSGISINSPTNTTSTALTTTASASSTSGNIKNTYTVTTGCVTVSSLPTNITIAPPPAVTTTATCFNSGMAGTYTFSVVAPTNVSGSTPYTWSCSIAGATISGNPISTPTASNTVSITVPAGTTQFTIGCSITTTTCSPLVATSYTTGNGTNPSAVANLNVVQTGFGPYGYFVRQLAPPAAPPAGLTYVWDEDGVPFTPAQTGSSYGANTPQPTSGAGHTNFLNVTINMGNGCFTYFSTALTDYRIAPAGGHDGHFNSHVLIYPNPNTGRFTIDVTELSDKGQMTVYNIAGQKVLEENLTKGTNNFNLKVASGVYDVRIVVDGMEHTGKIVINE